MSRNSCFPPTSVIEREILAYLAEHPHARDTLDGIVRWWLLERKIKFQTALVQEALDSLVETGLIFKHKGVDERMHYGIKARKPGAAALPDRE